MYNNYFQFKESPFSIAPNPRYLFMSDRHKEALAHLMYGINSDGGFILLTGEVGTGKTTVCRCLLEQLPDNTKVALILNPKQTAWELLADICDELGIERSTHDPLSTKQYVDLINRYLLANHAKNCRTVLIIEEAQNLDIDVMEQLRLLTNLETDQRKLLQIILVGQPELQELLAKKALRQLAQRITARYHLMPLSPNEVMSYVEHRLTVAGQSRPLFPKSSLKLLYKLSQGIPRLINVICDRALLGVYVLAEQQVNNKILRKAAAEVFGERLDLSPKKLTQTSSVSYYALGFSILLLVGVAYFGFAVPWFAAPSNNTNNNTPTNELIDPYPTTDSLNQRDQSPPSLESTFTSSGRSSTSTNSATDNTPLIWPKTVPIEQSTSLSYRALFQTWKLNYVMERDGAPCGYAKLKGLRCLSKSGNWRSLVYLNRPALLILRDDQGQSFDATLIRVNAESATLALASEQMTVPSRSIDAFWYGRYVILWKPPVDYSGPIKAGYQGNQVKKLKVQLAQLPNLGNWVNNSNSLFDSELTQAVKWFQKQHGLNPDGIVGVNTWIHLNSETATNVPLLRVIN